MVWVMEVGRGVVRCRFWEGMWSCLDVECREWLIVDMVDLGFEVIIDVEGLEGIEEEGNEGIVC